MRLQNTFPAKLITAIVALFILSIITGAFRAADQPKAGGPGGKSGVTASKASGANSAQKRKTALVMLGTRDNWHMKPEQVDALAGLLTGYCQLAAHFSDNPADFTVENIRKYDVVVLWSAFALNAQKEAPTKGALENVFKAVEAGTPLLSVHGGVYNTSIDGSPEIEEKIGCKYVKGPHFPYQEFKVKIDKAHPITEGVSDFLVMDEAYRLEMLDPSAEILASYDARLVTKGSLDQPGMKEEQKEAMRLSHQWGEKTAQAPVLYTRVLGKGRIVVNILGHDGEALRNPSVRALTEQSLRWLFTNQ
jgi:type 1 glutamine amidotransferase